MTKIPDDLLDPAEARLARRVGAYTDQAVFPVDAVAVAASVAAAGRRGRPGGRPLRPRLALVGAVAILAVAAIGVVISVGARGLFAPPSTPTAEPVAIRACTPYDVDAVITAWDGAAGHRIATVELHQIGTSACGVDPLPQVWLAAGHGDQLIVGKPAAGGPAIRFAPGGVLYTLVEAGNYCGPAPAAPVTVVFVQEGAAFVATALSPTDLSGVPPCNGAAGPTDDIAMHPWSTEPAN